VDKIRILYFLEDRAQEGFIKALVERIAEEESIPAESLIADIRSARGGYRIIKEFKKFLKDTIKIEPSEIDFLVIAVDGNCKGYRDRVKELEKSIRPNHPFKDRVVYAVPDPHIERWYIMDQRAFKEGVGLNRAPDMPQYKCKKAYYKQILNQALKESNVNSLLTGAEYAERIVENIQDLESFSRQNSGCQTFIEDLKRIFKSKMRR
jgi:hypothetical protein